MATCAWWTLTGAVVEVPPDGARREGRLEVFHNEGWGTVCDDRLDNPGNTAPQFACRLMGYVDGELVARGDIANMSLAPTAQPIWLDDVRCFAGSNHWTGKPPTKLHHCYHAGWGLHNCSHDEDVHLSCGGIGTGLQIEEDPLTPRRSRPCRSTMTGRAPLRSGSRSARTWRLCAGT